MTTETPAGQPTTRTLRNLLGIYFRGMAMGAADIVPGVSGGTMALILGIYEDLIVALRNLARPAFLRPLLRGHLREALKVVSAPFLAAVVLGIFTSVMTLSRLLEWLLEHQRAMVMSFFFGLVLASVLVVSRRVRRWNAGLVGILLIAAAAAYLVVGLSPAKTPDTTWFLFVSGALAICALILPGISGAFILVLLGKYDFVLQAVTRGDVGALAVAALGAAVGLLSFVQVLGWLLRRHHDLAIAILSGFMLGSLRKLWPWQDIVGSSLINRLPPVGEIGSLLLAVALLVVGMMVVLTLDRFDHNPH